MTNKSLFSFFKRQNQIKGFNESHFERLRLAHVTIVGVGGLGCAAAAEICAMGVGQLLMVDGDIVQNHNLHRQHLFTINDVGLKKALVAKNKLSEKFPFTEINASENFLSFQNIENLLIETDLILDCTDQISTRYLINDFCLINNLPWIFAGIDKNQGQLAVFNALGSGDFRSAFPNVSSKLPNCNDDGVVSFVPNILGKMQSIEAFKLLSGYGKPTLNEIKIIDFLSLQVLPITFKPNIIITQEIKLAGLIERHEYGLISIENVIQEIDWSNFYKIIKPEDGIYAIDDLPDDFPYHHQIIYASIDDFERVFFVCKHGKTSYSLALQAKTQNPGLEIFSIIGGIEQYVSPMHQQKN